MKGYREVERKERGEEGRKKGGKERERKGKRRKGERERGEKRTVTPKRCLGWEQIKCS